MSEIRIWKLGNIEKGIYPTQKSIEQLAKTLKKWDGYSDLDLIWDSEISVDFYTSDAERDKGRNILPDIKGKNTDE